MIILVGLGNPGKEYEKTRHNIGFRVIDALAKELQLSFSKAKFNGLIAEGYYRGEKILLVKPTTYMNRSGQTLQQLVNFYKISGKDLLVVYDDVDLEVGTLRLRKSGGAGTHNGMRDILAKLGWKDFPRLRIGIDQDKRIPLASYVLSTFSKEEEAVIEETLDKAVKALLLFLDEGIDAAMNLYNVRT